jgi:hypothetical protein
MRNVQDVSIRVEVHGYLDGCHCCPNDEELLVRG